jgi:heme o synthase
MNVSRSARTVKVTAPRWVAGLRAVNDLVILTKAPLTLLVVFTTLVGYLLGVEGAIPWSPLVWTLVGTGLTALSANAFNQWMEIRSDACMARTRNRPLPAGSMPPHRAVMLASGMMGVGLVSLVLAAGVLSAALAALTAAIYLVAYTPLKTRTSLCTLVGAVCGAIPPLIGWTAATGRLAGGAWVLAATLLVWQIPHFLALGWLHREDYAQAGFRMLPAHDQPGDLTGMLIILYCLALIPITASAWLVGLAGGAYVTTATVLGVGMAVLAVQFHRGRTQVHARRLFRASVAYLPLLFSVMLMDRRPFGLPGF